MRDVVEQAYPFLPATRAKLKEAIGQTVSLYAKCVTKSDISVANKQLRVHLREQIAWERDTVWRQMIDAERHNRADNDDDTDNEAIRAAQRSTHNFVVGTPLGTIRFRKKKIFVLIGLAVFIFLLNYSVVEGIEANNCFAILIFATILWASEVRLLFHRYVVNSQLKIGYTVIRHRFIDTPIACDIQNYTVKRCPLHALVDEGCLQVCTKSTGTSKYWFSLI